jgi:hypothetical protein
MLETVYTMTDWYDGPRRGVACYQGKPHLYESCWSDIETEYDVFLLCEISGETLILAIEDWEIWQRWSSAFARGETTRETHPSLPEDRSRHEELAQILRDCLIMDESKAVAATAQFLFKGDEPRMQAEWSIIEWNPSKDFRAKYGFDDDQHEFDDDQHE